MRRRSLVAGLLAALVAACADPTSPSGPARLAPLLEPSLDLNTRLVGEEYIVVLRDDADEKGNAQRARGRGGVVVATWRDALRGYAVRGGPASHGPAFRPDVGGAGRNSRSMPRSRRPPGVSTDRPAQPPANQLVPPPDGAGVRAHITYRIRTSQRVGGRAASGYDFRTTTPTRRLPWPRHVLARWAVRRAAKGVAGRRPRVCAGSGSTWSASPASTAQWNGAVAANMSRGAPVVHGRRDHQRGGLARRGGSGTATSAYLPLVCVATAITVATTSTDARACTPITDPDLLPRGEHRPGTSTATAVLSGTSMASPHVAVPRRSTWRKRYLTSRNGGIGDHHQRHHGQSHQCSNGPNPGSTPGL